MANHWHYCTGRGIDMVGQYVRKGLLMNDRIQELAEQATEVSEFLSGECCPPTPNLEKFAELIIKDIGQIVSGLIVPETPEQDTGPYEHWNRALATVASEIEQHFYGQAE